MREPIEGRHWLNDYSLGRIVMTLFDCVAVTLSTVITRLYRVEFPHKRKTYTASAILLLFFGWWLFTGTSVTDKTLGSDSVTVAGERVSGSSETVKLSAYAPKPSWVPSEVSLNGGQLTKPKQAFDYAKQLKLPFVNSEAELQNSIEKGDLVPLDLKYAGLVDVSSPYVLIATRDFTRRLGSQYVSAGCGKFIVTSALRMPSKQPENASVYSVHPTGMSVDFRVPKDERCREWLTKTLLAIEATGQIDATLEKKPKHFHVVVVKEAYEHWLSRLMAEIAAKNRT